jgi:CheY-like chemotaxis protein
MLLDATLEADAASTKHNLSSIRLGSQRRLTGMRVLVVEDNLINQQIAEELLSAEGAKVSLAANGEIGVHAIQAAATSNQFHAVLMDIQMPVMDGYAATKFIRERLGMHDLPIVAMTANAMASDREECIAGGMDEHIGKPFDLDQLVHTLLLISRFQPEMNVLVDADEPQAELIAEQTTGRGNEKIDLQAVLKRLGGLTSVYVRAAREFMQVLPSQIDQLARMSAEQRSEIAALAHVLKGTSATLGANTLSLAAARIERLCKGNDGGEDLKHAVGQLKGIADEALVDLRAALMTLEASPLEARQNDESEGASSDGAAINPDAALIDLNALISLLEQGSLDALEWFASSRDALCNFPQSMVAGLELALQDLDFPSALEACQLMQTWHHASFTCP